MVPGRPLPEVLSDILALQGAVLEKTADDCVEFLSPPSLSKMLDIPEHGRMSFTYQPSRGDAISAGYDSDLFRAIASVFSGESRITIATYPSPAKRLNRDIKRVFEYYETIKIETQKVMEKRALTGEHPSEKQGEKVNAIETEKRWKIQDLISKYALNIRVEPVAAILIETQSPVFWLEIKRRLSSRLFPLTYNPLLRKLDPLPCESCFYPRGGYFICDEKLHITCSACFKKCPQCGKPFCSACHKHGCPRCSKGLGK